MISSSDEVPVRGVVFDAVGTLIEPSPSVSEAYGLAAHRQGCEIDLQILKRRFRDAFATDEIDEPRGPFATSEANETRRWRRIVAKCLPEVPDPDRAFEELWDHFGDPASWIVFPEVAETVACLQAVGLAMCVASNFDGRLHRVAAGFAELRDWVEPLVISSEVGFRKPHRAFYLAASARLGLRPSEILWVGDDLVNDVQGPRDAGMRAVLVDRRNSAPEGELPLADLGGLIDLLGKSGCSG